MRQVLYVQWLLLLLHEFPNIESNARLRPTDSDCLRGCPGFRDHGSAVCDEIIIIISISISIVVLLFLLLLLLIIIIIIIVISISIIISSSIIIIIIIVVVVVVIVIMARKRRISLAPASGNKTQVTCPTEGGRTWRAISSWTTEWTGERGQSTLRPDSWTTTPPSTGGTGSLQRGSQ